jgi:hypothetical protein
MISVIMPLGQRHRSPRVWVARGAIYLAATTAGGALLGALLGGIGASLRALVPFEVLIVAAALLAAAYGLHEAGVWRLPRPERAWQVPNSWIMERPLLGAVAFGLILGAGIFTFIPFTSFYLLLVWELLSGPVAGAVLGGAYGLARALPVLAGAWTSARGAPIAPLHMRILTASPTLHRATSGLLLVSAVLLLVPLLLALAP